MGGLLRGYSPEWVHLRVGSPRYSEDGDSRAAFAQDVRCNRFLEVVSEGWDSGA
jgi:hypothetical protein